jgi:hypothetical protein
MVTPQCKKCKKPGKMYQVGIVKEPTKEWPFPISWYRCFCIFCDKCLPEVKDRNPDKIYVPFNYPYPKHMKELNEIYNKIIMLANHDSGFPTDKDRFNEAKKLVSNLSEKWSTEYELELLEKRRKGEI